MYYRIKSRFEVTLMEQELRFHNVPESVISRMYEITEILDSNYGSQRTACSMGGYLLFFPTSKDFVTNFPVILSNYNIDPTLSEYNDILESTSAINWREQLYLLGSDDALVFIYQE